jgi:murein DD-endopeptidase MepM/ murein hydrolase activator NlpD
MALALALLVAVLPNLAGLSAWWSLPVDAPAGRPPVVTPFAPPAQPWLAGHRGVDLAARRGAPIRAAADGVVVFAGPLAGRGVVSIQHRGGLRSTYEPVLALVRPGAAVRSGQLIGVLDHGSRAHQGCGDRSCLHWGVRAGSVYLDPLSLLVPTTVRLLPAPAEPWPATQSGSGARVRLTVGTPQPIDRDVRVALGGRHGGVPE